jgi:hypothetical protein
MEERALSEVELDLFSNIKNDLYDVFNEEEY